VGATLIPKHAIKAHVPKVPFDIDAVIKHAEQMVIWEEPMRALWILNNLPAYFRDHEPTEVTDLKLTILRKIYTVQDYASNSSDDVRPSHLVAQLLDNLARGVVIRDAVKEANQKGVTPHIVDFGPGDYWMAIGLDVQGLKFTYRPVALQGSAYTEAKMRLEHLWVEREVKDRPNWLVAYEIIEHLKDEDEIAQEAARCALKPDKVFLSTPRYIFDGGDSTLRNHWKKNGLPHLRCYTPDEFLASATRMFPKYQWMYCDDPVMVLRGDLS
jgi:hypothetical protein